ncbi:hypothetical protein FSP39_017071 [Pinctada imbricata]|uniref:Arrestin C-terminal-like domain-containing protein n=1 Tax=Pinctada imbricata TaxID=66713 RepID=A0AA89C3U8_PINIB|nr:hypothetical protein FSP39_017071 [Pinctada imbricata]
MFESKVKAFDILLSNSSGVFYGGQQVAGKVILVVENDLKLRVGQDDYVFKPGSYEYPFSFVLPPNTPTSYESHIGRVRYVLKANIDRPWAFDTSMESYITVLTPLDLNTCPDATSMAENEDSKTLCCLCCESGPITGKIKLDRMGYVCGEAITPKGDVMNSSNRKMSSVSVNLIQEVHYITPRKTRRQTSTAAQCILGELGENKPLQVHGTRLIVPPLPPSGLVGCNIIDIHYYVELRVSPKGIAFDLSVLVPVVIGSIPLAATVQQYGVPPPLQQSTQIVPSAPPGVPSVVLPSDIPPPSYAPSHFGPASMTVTEEQQPAGTNAVAPAQQTNTWAPQNSYSICFHITKKKLASQFNWTYRYIDDVPFINNPTIQDYLRAICHSALELEETTECNTSASYLDIILSISDNGHLNASLHDKHDDLNLTIKNSRFMSSKFPFLPAYNVFISQLIRYARACSKYENFILRIISKLLAQCYLLEFKMSLRKFYGH